MKLKSIILLLSLSALILGSCNKQENQDYIYINRLGNTSGHKVTLQFANGSLDISQGQYVDTELGQYKTDGNSILVVYDDTLKIRHFLCEIPDSAKTSYRFESTATYISYPPEHNIFGFFNIPIVSYYEGDKAVCEYVVSPYDYLIAVQYQDSVPPVDFLND